MTTVQLDNPLEGLPEAFILLVMIYYSERIQINISQGKNTQGSI